MFCKNCGNFMSDDAKFCANCGTAVEGGIAPAQSMMQPQGAPIQPAKPFTESPVVKNFLSVVKGFFTGHAVEPVEAAAQNKTLEWIALIAANILFFGLGLALFLRQRMFFSFGMGFGVGLLIALLFNGSLLGGFCLLQLCLKKPISLFGILNVIGYATMPLTSVLVVNLLVGFIWSPLAVLLFMVSFMMTLVLAYEGTKVLVEYHPAAFYGYALLVLAVFVVTLGIGALLFKILIFSTVSSMFGGLMGGLGGLSSLF